MNKKLRWALIALLAVVLAGTLGYIIYRDIDRAAGVEIYDEAQLLAGVPDLEALMSTPTPAPTPTPPPAESGPAESEEPAPTETPEQKPAEGAIPVFEALESVDLAALRARSPEVLGWIAIPGVLSYPLMRGQDNSYYLTHTWNGVRNSVGSVFMDYRCGADFSDFNTVIYAHRTRGGAMFGTLSQYASQSFWAAHPDVYLVTDGGIIRYRVYAAYEAELTAPAYYNHVSTEEGRENFISSGTEASGISGDVRPGPDDQILTLSTCTGSGHSTRWVVQAVRAEG